MNDLKKGVFFILEGQPYEVLFSQHLKMQQRRPVMQARIKNLVSGKIIERNFQQSDYFKQADIQKRPAKFLYFHRKEFWFSEINDLSKRFEIDAEVIGESALFLKPGTIVESLLFNGKVINILLPVKMDFKVIEAPPGVRGNTMQGGTKQVKIETGASINTPLFIEEGDIITVNTQTGEYSERVEKAR